MDSFESAPIIVRERPTEPIGDDIFSSLYAEDPLAGADTERPNQFEFETTSRHRYCSKLSSNTSTTSDRSQLFFFDEDLAWDSLSGSCSYIREEDESFPEEANRQIYLSEKWKQFQSQDYLASEMPQRVPEEPKKQIQEERSNCQVQFPYNTRDETKNIPKNYIKAILHFILTSPIYLGRLFTNINQKSLEFALFSSSERIEHLRRQEAEFLCFVKEQRGIKRYTIERLKELWMHDKFGKVLRIISIEFLRKRSLGYIFESKIERKMSHVKHRNRLMEALRNPTSFTNIKN